MVKKEIMKNVSFPIYKNTQDRYLEFKKKHELTHDKALNKLLDTQERVEEEKAIRQDAGSSGKNG